MEETLIECLDCHVIFPGNENHSCRIYKILCGRVKQGLLNPYVKGNGASTSNVLYVNGAHTVDCNILTDNSVKNAESQRLTEDLRPDNYFVNMIPNSQNVKFPESEHGHLKRNTNQKHFLNPNSLRENSAYICPIDQHSIALQPRDHSNSYLGSPVNTHLNISKFNNEMVSTISKNPASAREMDSGITESDKTPHVYDPKRASILQAHNEQPSNEYRNENKLLASRSDVNLVSDTTCMNHETPYRIENGRYICLLCEKSYSAKSSFVVHFRTHSGENPYVCDECGKRFFKKANLRTHLLTHTGEKRYVCNECGKRFAQKSNLSTHLLTHTGEKRYVCDECGKKFTKKCSLHKHLLSHTGEKPFACSQ